MICCVEFYIFPILDFKNHDNLTNQFKKHFRQDLPDNSFHSNYFPGFNQTNRGKQRPWCWGFIFYVLDVVIFDC